VSSSSPTAALTTLDDVKAAAQRLEGVTRVTPVLRPANLSTLAGRPLVLKCEQLQRTGSFKLRGAYRRICELPAGSEVVTASAGNHAQGVALASSLCGLRATVFMPSTAALPKVQATRDYGADVELVGASFEDANAAARKYTENESAVYVPPFDDPLVIAGQGTVGLELAEQAPEIDAVVVPVGGGGLIGGVGATVKALLPGCRVVGVEPEGAADMERSLAAGEPVLLERIDTIADGIAVKQVSRLTLAHAQAFVDEVVTVTDEEIARAQLLLLERAKQVVEPSGAAALAAVLARKVPGGSESPVAVVCSGGNVDPSLLGRLIGFGLNAAGRHLLLRVVMLDRPGELHRLLGVISGLGINVVQIDHHREGTAPREVDEVYVELALETRNHEHQQEARRAIAVAGFRLS
jgi:threonine dehydratase